MATIFITGVHVALAFRGNWMTFPTATAAYRAARKEFHFTRDTIRFERR